MIDKGTRERKRPRKGERERKSKEREGKVERKEVRSLVIYRKNRSETGRELES